MESCRRSGRVSMERAGARAEQRSADAGTACLLHDGQIRQQAARAPPVVLARTQADDLPVQPADEEVTDGSALVITPEACSQRVEVLALLAHRKRFGVEPFVDLLEEGVVARCPKIDDLELRR